MLQRISSCIFPPPLSLFLRTIGFFPPSPRFLLPLGFASLITATGFNTAFCLTLSFSISSLISHSFSSSCVVQWGMMSEMLGLIWTRFAKVFLLLCLSLYKKGCKLNSNAEQG